MALSSEPRARILGWMLGLVLFLGVALFALRLLYGCATSITKFAS